MVQIDIRIRKVAPSGGEALRSPRSRPANMAKICQLMPFVKPPQPRGAREVRMRPPGTWAGSCPCAPTFPCRAPTYAETVKWRSRLNCTRAFLADNPHFDRVQANARLHTPHFRPVVGTAASMLPSRSKSESTLSLDKNHWTYAMTRCAMEHQSNARMSRVCLLPDFADELIDGVRPQSCPIVNKMPKRYRGRGNATPTAQTAREAPMWSSLQKADHVTSGSFTCHQMPLTPVGSIESSAVFGPDTPRSRDAPSGDHDDMDRCVYTTPTNQMLHYYISADGSERDSDGASQLSETPRDEQCINMLELPEVDPGRAVRESQRGQAVMPPFTSRQLVFRKSGRHFTRIRAGTTEKAIPFHDNQFVRIQRPALLTNRRLTGRKRE